MKRYNPAEIEPKWQAVWDKNQNYKADLKSSKPKYLAMSMLNYPSGSGIHIGHAMNYTISDVMARFKRQQGYESYHPVGWDSFGLPAENYAIKSGVSPQQSMAKIIPMYHKQYKAMGWSNDWSKEISTHEPEYYKWTQWIFSEMFRNGLAYQASRLQWWCPIDNSVLADEQVTPEGKCWRHDGPDDPPAEKKEVKQWFFKITDYADELLEAIEDLDWTESVKLAQKNWIGKSQGAEIDFAMADSNETITVFTTRPDTIFGATYLVLAPEHHLIDHITTEKQKLAVKEYRDQALRKTEIERQEDKSKSGVFTGSYAVNPANGESIPIWIAEYVLTGYGTGAIIAVPAHDERDYEFAKQHNLPVIYVVEPTFGEAQGDDIQSEKIYAALRNPKNNTILVLDWGPRQKNYGGHMLIGGSVEAGESHEAAVEREILEETGYKNFKLVKKSPFKGHGYFYSNTKHQNFHASGYGFLFDLIDEEKTETNLDHGEKNKFKAEWLPVNQVAAILDDGTHAAMFRFLVLDEQYTGEGVLINSGQYNGMDTAAAREKIIEDLAMDTGDKEPLFVQKTEPGKVKEGQPFVERQAITALVKHWSEDKYIGLKWKQVDWETLITGGVEEGQTPAEAAIAEIQEETGYLHPKLIKNLGKTHAKFYHVPKKENRHAHFSCLVFELADGERKDMSSKEQAIHEVIWLTPEQMETFHLPESHRYMWNKYVGKTGKARTKTHYRMRDWSVSRQRYWGAPIPIIHCPDHGAVLVPDEELPVELPEIKDFAPKGDGRSALARAEKWLKSPCPKCGKIGERETDTLDTYICSSWYFIRYIDPHNHQKAFDLELANKWLPLDFYNGADHATAHMIYARFVTRFFQKQGLLDNPEPFKKFLFNGKVTAQDGTNFSKSKGNGPDPLEIIGSGYGADALRMYLMFAAPLDQWVRWDPQGVPGTYRFLQRLWTIVDEFLEAKESSDKQQKILTATHKTIKKVTADLESQKYNTAIAAMMALLNDLYKAKAKKAISQSPDWRFSLESLVQLAAPFAPYIAEELWQALGHKDSVHIDHWPQWVEKLAKDDKLTLAVQVNGKVRSEIEVEADISEGEAIESAQSDERVQGFIKGKEIKKSIYVPGRLVNLVIE